MKPTLLVLAAGLGSRYGGVKQLDSIGEGGECLLDYATYDAMLSGFGQVIYIIRRDIEEDFRKRLFDRVAKNFSASYVFQDKTSLIPSNLVDKCKNRTKPWGTTHAVLCAKEVIKTPFMVINSDDYYGRVSFKIMGEYLSSIENNSTEHAMVGYTLKNTLSENGSVSRGVCTVKEGYLSSICENLKIYYDKEVKSIISDMPESKVKMQGDECVSMNLFGLTPQAFNSFSKYWEEFLKQNISNEKKEALLPESVFRIIQGKEGKVKVFNTDERWFGMTYPEDKEVVKKEIKKKIDTGYYPVKLWNK